jgi:hypothetical protein
VRLSVEEEVLARLGLHHAGKFFHLGFDGDNGLVAQRRRDFVDMAAQLINVSVLASGDIFVESAQSTTQWPAEWERILASSWICSLFADAAEQRLEQKQNSYDKHVKAKGENLQK